MNKFAERLRELRLEKKLTQIELADSIGVSFAIISKWENCKRQPTLENIKALSRFLNVTADYLIGLKDY